MQPKKITVRLSSGGTVTVEKILLFPQDKLAQATALRIEGSQKLQGWSSGLGFIGPLPRVMMNATMLGLLEQFVSDKVQISGLNMISQADFDLQEAKSQGVYFPIVNIKNIAIPSPNAWVAARSAGSTETDSYVHDGSTFFIMKDANNVTGALFLSHIELWIPVC